MILQCWEESHNECIVLKPKENTEQALCRNQPQTSRSICYNYLGTLITYNNWIRKEIKKGYRIRMDFNF